MPTEPGWEPAPSGVPALEPGSVHLWRAPLDHPPGVAQRFELLATPAESVRADRFRTQELRARFLAGRALVRVILSRYLDLPPANVPVVVGEHGKPALGPPHHWLRFNASNSQGWMVLALARDREVGVDLEALRPVPEALSIADRMLSASEVDALRATPAEGLEAAFLSLWTCKEAFIKAIGAGLWRGMDAFDVEMDPSGAPALTRVRGSADEAARWVIRRLAPGEGFCGALVCEAPLTRVLGFDWSGSGG